ncbi:hypothetical protein ACFFSY_04540 [Paenibacillus aurantiacus]|uniref:Uncharacterized protein n=1 Tax=Paenibacillus aurantiacus TaxID=1936118 RepID=A0ABV5KJX8_9BACL
MTGNLRQTIRGYRATAVKELYADMTAKHIERMNGLREELAELRADNERLAAELARIPSIPPTSPTSAMSREEEAPRVFEEGALLVSALAEANALVEAQARRLEEQRARHEADKARHARLRAEALARLEARLGEAMARWRGEEEEGE